MTRRGAASCLLAGLFSGLLGSSPADAASPEELFARGNEQYAKGDYAGAVGSYEAILAAGIENSAVFYNLGNACFRSNALGRAILYYEKALKLDPSDADARENLRFARQRIRDRIPEEEPPFLVALLVRIRDSLRLEQVTRIYLALHWGAMILASVWILSAGRRAGVVCGIASVVVFALALGAGGWMLAQGRARGAQEAAIVLAEKADVLSGPGSENTLLASVHEGTRVRMHNRRGGWIQVTLPDGRAGWVQEAALASI